MFSMCSATMKLKNFLSHLLSKKEKRKEPALSRLFFDLTQPMRAATSLDARYFCANSYFNLTQPVRVATANLYKRSNKLSCILYGVCLLFDQTIWSDTTYCNGIISFLYNIWCEATGKTMFTYHSHL